MEDKELLGFAADEDVSISKIAMKYGWTGTKLNEVLHDFFIIRHGIEGNTDWCLTDDYEGHGYSVMAIAVNSKDGLEHKYMLWTAKGRRLIYNLLKYEIGIIPESATEYKEKLKKEKLKTTRRKKS